MDNMSLADIAAVTNKDKCSDGFFGEGGFFWIVVLFLVFGMMGGGLWGNNNGLQGALTRGEMADGFNTAQILRNQSDIMRDQFGVQRDILENRFTAQQCCCQTQQNIMQSRYDNALGQAATQREIMDNRFAAQLGFQNVQAHQEQCCCDLKTAVHAEAEATRALITANEMQALRDKLQLAQAALNNDAQTQQLLSAINKVPQPAYLTCSPYQATYNPYVGGCNSGCGYSNGFSACGN